MPCPDAASARRKAWLFQAHTYTHTLTFPHLDLLLKEQEQFKGSARLPALLCALFHFDSGVPGLFQVEESEGQAGLKRPLRSTPTACQL